MTPPPQDRAHHEEGGCHARAQGARFYPNKGRGRFQNRLEIVSYSTKHKTRGHFQWKQNRELEAGSYITVEILKIRGRKPFGQEAMLYVINTGVDFKEDFVERKKGK